jgi:hypothetical protein
MKKSFARSGIMPAVIVALCIASGFTEKPSRPAISSEDTSTDSILKFWLREHAVDNSLPVSKTFWLWLDPRELDSVLQQNALLRHSLPQSAFEQLYHAELFRKKWDRHPLAEICRGSSMLRKCDAWPNYWSQNRLEFDPAKSQLVKVELEYNALIVAFLPDEKDPWRVYDLSGNRVLITEAIRKKSQIAAIFIAGTAPEPILVCNSGGETYPMSKQKGRQKKFHYRSFMLCNEEMIRTWQHAVPGVQDQQLNDLNYLLLLHAYLSEPEYAKPSRAIHKCWDAETKSPDATVQTLFNATQRLSAGDAADSSYTREAISEIRRCWPIQANPAERFPSR